MERLVGVFTVALALAVPAPPAPAMQHNIAVSGRLGTLGLGADVTVALNERVAVRAGAGFLGFDVDLTGRFGLADTRTAELSLPMALFTLGAEVSSGLFRAGAGLVLRAGDPTYEITYLSGATIDIGGGFYQHPEVRTLTTTLVSGSVAPYVLVGFGSSSRRGFEFMVDLGAVLHPNPKFDMAAKGDPSVLDSPLFRADLETERREAEDDAVGFVRFWPIVSIGLRYRLK